MCSSDLQRQSVLQHAGALPVEEDFARDVAQSRQVNYQAWRRRPFFERGHELLGWLLERQQ